MTPGKLPHSPAAVGEQRRARIVVVEDDADTRLGLQELLAGFGFDVAATGDGNVGLGYMRGTLKPALVLLDLYMPGLSGFEFYERVQRDPELAAIPVIVVTAAPPNKRIGLKVAAIIRKPIDVQELMFAVRRVVALGAGRPDHRGGGTVEAGRPDRRLISSRDSTNLRNWEPRT